MNDEEGSELRRLSARTRTYVAAMVLSFFLQGAFLVNAVRSEESLGAWLTWGVVFVIALAGIVFTGVRASRLARRYRRLRWGER
ncbi:hypothetical protein [Microbacterium mcarthurae (nom. nud.)]|uniref:Uncharacterized protein n=1 Tax=Microbacterium mcarthurae TaxID=3035918 RepID=A0ABW9GDN0_9MICO